MRRGWARSGGGQMMAYLDLDQISFLFPALGDHRRRARSLAAIWRIYRTAVPGASHGRPVDDEATITMYADGCPMRPSPYVDCTPGRII